MQTLNRPLLIGITGTLGSGKSSFCHFIEQYYPVVYADRLANEVLSAPTTMQVLSDRWGLQFFPAGKPDKQAIANLVFNDRAELDFINSVIHPQVLSRIQAHINASTAMVLFFEIPLLFEAKLENCFDHIILITVSPEIRLKRLQKRDNLNTSEIEVKIKAQLPENIKALLADTIISNDHTLDELKSQAERFNAGLADVPRKSVLPFV